MSKQVTIKNQTRLRVYLEKVKINDTKSINKTINADRKRPRAN